MLTRRNKQKLTIFNGIALILVLALMPNLGGPANADKKTDLQTEISQKQQQLNQLSQQISGFKTEIKQLGKQQASLKNEINLYNLQIQATQVQIDATSTNIDNTNLQIDQTKAEIADKIQQIADEKRLLASLIQSLNQYDNTSGLQLGLGSNNFSDLMDQMQYTDSLQSKVYSVLQQIKDLKARLEKSEADLQQSLQKLQDLETELVANQTALTDQKNAKLDLLATTRGQESRYQKLLSSTQSQQDKLTQEINDLDNQLNGRKDFNKLQPIHGILAWPMDGVVTQGFGNTGFTKLGYNFHNGIDLAGPAGTPIHAAADGVVVGTGSSDASYGNWVAIKHTITTANGHQIITLYGHMMRFLVSDGQNIKQGDVIGYEGNTGNTTRLLYGPDRGYHLHFTVFDATGFGIAPGKYSSTYGAYTVPYGYVYNPYDFL